MLKIISGHIPQEEIPFPDLTNFVFPENNRHPDDYMGFSKWIVELSIEKDIKVFSYSPAFIECLSVLCIDFDVEVKFIFYTKNQEKKVIGDDELYIIYNDLAKPYDEADLLRLKIEYYGIRKTRNKSCSCKVNLDE